MADIISNILIGGNPKVKPRSFGVGDNTATYKCMVGENVLSPVAGTIENIDASSNEVIIKSRGGKYTINGCNVSGVVATGAIVSSGSPIGKTSGRQITLKSSQDLSSLESTDEKKENSVNNTSDGQIGFNTGEIQGVWDKLVGKPIAISNIPYDVASKRIKKAIKKVTLKKESIDIKDNVLSEELKRIKSLF
jgi:hypothetical protein